MATVSKPVLGIMALYLNERQVLEERSVYAKMSVAGARLGLNVVVFTPADVDSAGRVRAQVYQARTRSWQRRTIRMPSLIYDRCRIQKSKRFEQLLEFRKKYGHLTFLNRPLRNKWTVYRTLARMAPFQEHLPATRLYTSPEDVESMLRRHSLVYVKPINGTGGRGILRIEKLRGGKLLLQGRDHSRRIIEPKRITRDRLAAALKSWSSRGDRYIVQQGLHIQLPSGRVHDYRLLVQKNGSGQWEATGCAGRVGPPRSVTSNLHGGGRAAPMNTLLRQWIGSESAVAQIRSAAEELGLQAARSLEAAFGTLCELALDLAIDRNGRIWLLEVNPKPSREVFIRAGEPDVYYKAVSRPLEYALWLSRQRRDGRSPRPAAAEANRTGTMANRTGTLVSAALRRGSPADTGPAKSGTEGEA